LVVVPQFSDAIENFRRCGAALSLQTMNDWRGPFGLPADVEKMYLELGPVDVEIPALGNPIWVPALRDLWETQIGYRIHALTGETLPDWPVELLVVAQEGGNPIAIDTRSSTIEAALAGSGEWAFEPFASCLQSAIYAIGLLGSIVELNFDDLCDESGGVDSDQSRQALEMVATRVGHSDASQILKWLGWLT
jgi:hypothetical protein